MLFCVKTILPKDIATLKELSELYYITFNDEDLLAVTLARALKMTEDDVGSVMVLVLEMRQSLSDVKLDITRKFGTELTMGISVHAGEAVLGNFGFEKKMNYTVIGDPVNFVFKLQSLCRAWPNEVLISENTLRAAQANYLREEVGAFEVESEAPQPKIYRLL